METSGNPVNLDQHHAGPGWSHGARKALQFFQFILPGFGCYLRKATGFLLVVVGWGETSRVTSGG